MSTIGELEGGDSKAANTSEGPPSPPRDLRLVVRLVRAATGGGGGGMGIIIVVIVILLAIAFKVVGPK